MSEPCDYERITIKLDKAADLVRLLAPTATERDAVAVTGQPKLNTETPAATNSIADKDNEVQDRPLWCQTLTGANAGDGARDWVFRGVKDASFDGRPSAWRAKSLALTWAKKPAAVTGEQDSIDQTTLCIAEAAVLREYFQKADAQGLPIPGDCAAVREWAALKSTDSLTKQLKPFGPDGGVWPPTALFPLAALAQHTLGSTRLLDWSRRPLVAAWFAASDAALQYANEREDKEKGAANDAKALVVWAAKARVANKQQERLFVKAGQHLSAPNRSSNQNLHMQSGKMAYLPSTIEDGEAVKLGNFDLLCGLADAANHFASENSRGPTAYLRRFTLPWTEAGALLSLLGAYFVHGATIYSGHRGVDAAVMQDIVTGRKRRKTS